jgi:hypothetical protein
MHWLANTRGWMNHKRHPSSAFYVQISRIGQAAVVRASLLTTGQRDQSQDLHQAVSATGEAASSRSRWPRSQFLSLIVSSSVRLKVQDGHFPLLFHFTTNVLLLVSFLDLTFLTNTCTIEKGGPTSPSNFLVA